MWRWDVFCVVVDHYGDIGTCWRLVQQLAFEHQVSVRLWVDDLQRFACLCPSVWPDAAVQHVGPIEVRQWTESFPDIDPADVVVEAFACTIPANYIAAMVNRAVPPVWINLEYLSAENWVDECHGLPSPHSAVLLLKYFVFPGLTPSTKRNSVQEDNPAKKFFFFPGFSSKTGGLLREQGLLADRDAFDQAAASQFWQGLDLAPPSDDEIRISLFCYHNDALPELLQTWADGPTCVRLLVSPCPAVEQISDWLRQSLSREAGVQRNSLTVHALPFLSQAEYDRLLWACDVNFVRGEDSFVRGQWAQKPFVWHIYPQSEDAHLVKLEAFLHRYLEGFESAEAVRNFWLAWNGRGKIAGAWRDFIEIRQSLLTHGRDWAAVLDRLGNLADNLVRFARQKLSD